MAGEPTIAIDPDEGPVMVTVEYQIDPARAAEFAAVMEETRGARLRQGVLSWSLFRDTSVPGRYVEHFVDESWVEHLRRHQRFTAADAGLRERRAAFHIGESASEGAALRGGRVDALSAAHSVKPPGPAGTAAARTIGP